MEAKNQDLAKAMALIKFTREMSAMINAGINLANCNVTISKEDLPPYNTFCSALQERWEKNEDITLSSAMAERPDLFSPFYISTIHWGEIGGILEEAYAQLAELLETTLKMWAMTGKQANWAWLLYPSEKQSPQNWNELNETHKTFILMMFNKSLGLMLSTGVPFLVALNTAAEFIPAAQREEFRRGSEQFVNSNKSWGAYLVSCGIIPAFMTSMVAAGEAAGMLDAILEKIAMVYQKQLECELM